MKKWMFLLWIAGPVLLGGCTTETVETDDGGGDETTTYAADVSTTLDTYCGDCHSGAGCPAGPCFATDYSVISGSASAGACTGLTTAQCIKVRLEDGSMPRSDAACPLDDPGCITSADVSMIEAWIADGMPE